MAAILKSTDQRLFIWLAAGVVVGVLASTNPFYQPDVTLQVAIAVWFTDMVLAVLMSIHRITARLGTLLIGLSLAVPCFLRATPLSRGLLMCCMVFPLLIVALPLLAPPTTNYRQRLAYLFTWLGTREVNWRPRAFDVNSLLHFIAATLVLCAAIAAVKATPDSGGWLLPRWLAGGIMLLAFAEMLSAVHDFLAALIGITAPALMRSPALSVSLSEFWTRRWNPAASFLLFRRFFFAPLARRGAAVALCVAFIASAVAHVLLPYMAVGKFGISLLCGAFFLVQPLLIAAERSMNVRRWPRAAARLWTLTALAITSPLFVEPALQVVEPSWGRGDDLLLPILAIVAFVVGINLFFLVGCLAAVRNPE